jgi:tetrahydromethanopterin S-methyltransferase subunit D
VIVLQSVGAITQSGLPANLALADVLNTCGSELARDGGITGNITAD